VGSLIDNISISSKCSDLAIAKTCKGLHILVTCVFAASLGVVAVRRVSNARTYIKLNLTISMYRSDSSKSATAALYCDL
jgi:hypothetical protein